MEEELEKELQQTEDDFVEDFIEETQQENSGRIECIQCKFHYEQKDIEENDKCFICNQSRGYFKSDAYKKILKDCGIEQKGE